MRYRLGSLRHPTGPAEPRTWAMRRSRVRSPPRPLSPDESERTGVTSPHEMAVAWVEKPGRSHASASERASGNDASVTSGVTVVRSPPRPLFPDAPERSESSRHTPRRDYRRRRGLPKADTVLKRSRGHEGGAGLVLRSHCPSSDQTISRRRVRRAVRVVSTVHVPGDGGDEKRRTLAPLDGGRWSRSRDQPRRVESNPTAGSTSVPWTRRGPW